MSLKQEIEFRDALMSFANKLKMFEIIRENLVINDFSKTLIILKKKIRYKLSRLLRATIVTTINNEEKTSNDSAFNKCLLNYLFLLSV